MILIANGVVYCQHFVVNRRVRCFIPMPPDLRDPAQSAFANVPTVRQRVVSALRLVAQYRLMDFAPH